jgi:hypothetical protein
MEPGYNYQISASVNEGILEIIFTGEITGYDVNKLHNDVIMIIKEEKPRGVLNDLRALKGRYENFADAYFRTRDIPRNTIRIPSAVVDTPKDTEYQSFYETTAANAGILIKWFNDIEEARAWLKSQI